MTFNTRLTDRFGIEHPVVLAPMDDVADARLASAVSAAGGLGLLGGGYADADWVRQQFDQVSAAVGCGFITWTLKGNEHVLEHALARGPAALFLSFGDPAPYAPRIRESRWALTSSSLRAEKPADTEKGGVPRSRWCQRSWTSSPGPRPRSWCWQPVG
ncbi:Hypothetical 2-nitropropane dioxygenase [Mycobacteroides abscessus subsp. abscessus]|nr:Hypothetical 2-nitropropane dioxygenase [Mycobacteroides abscessus subsp. abscessus]